MTNFSPIARRARFAAVWLAATVTLSMRADPPAVATAAGGDTFLRDYAETRGFMLGRPVNATPTPDGSAVLFLRAKSAREPSQELYEFNVASGQTHRLLSPEDALRGAAESLSPEEKARRERQRVSVGGFTAFSISKSSALVLLSLSGKLYVLDRVGRTARELATGPGVIVDPKFSPDSRSVAYVRGEDVYTLDLASGRETAVTSGGTETVTHGLAEFVAQEEMNRFSGFWWSPDSRQIAFEESNAATVESWYVADPAKPGNVPSRTFYPRPGKDNVTVRVGVVSVDGSEATVWLKWDREKYPYLGKVAWNEHGPLTLTVLSRDQTDLALLTADPIWGDTSALLTEHDDAWVNLPQDVPLWLSEKDGGGFLWASERNDWRQLERHDAAGVSDGSHIDFLGTNLRQLVGVAGGRAFGIVSTELPRTMALCAAPLDANPEHGTRSRFGKEGLVQANLSDCQTVYAMQEQTLDEMPRTSVRRVSDGTFIGELPSVAAEPPFKPNVPVGTTGFNNAQGQGFRYPTVVIHPQNFNAAAKDKYPVIVDVYGGPEHQQVISSMRPYLLDQWIADQGFIVVAFDGRGTPGCGRNWEKAVAGHFGSVPLEDQVQALQGLKKNNLFPEMDLDRVGITGWSFGGYMSALAVLRRPDVFKAAVAGAPVSDWMDYDTCYTERYLGVPGAGRWPDAYREGSLLTYAGDLQRPLLVIHGTADDNVYLRHSLKLTDALFRAGKTAEFLPLNSFTHMVPDPVVRARLEERIVEYFHRHLGFPSPATASGTGR